MYRIQNIDKYKPSFYRAVCITIFIFFCFINGFKAQQNQVVSNVFHGSVVGLGWGVGVTSGTNYQQLYFDCASCSNIGKAYLIAPEYNIYDSLGFQPSSVVIIGQTIQFTNETRVSPKFINPIDNSTITHAVHFVPFNFQCNGTNFINFYIPYKDWKSGLHNFYLIIECLDNAQDLVGYSLVLNTGDSDPNMMVTPNEAIPITAIDNSKDVGFAMVGAVMMQITDASSISFNGNYLGNIFSADASSVNYAGTGVRGHFQYANGTLVGLDDDTPDLVMDSTDALALVQGLIPPSNDFYFSCVQIDPPSEYGYYTSPVVGGILTYTPVCDTFSVNMSNDTTVCYGEQFPLSVSGGSTYEWYPATGLSCTDCPNPVFTAESSVFYTVKIFNNDSCFVSKALKVTVLPQLKFDSIIVSPSECGLNTGKVFFSNTGNSGFNIVHEGGVTLFGGSGTIENLPSGFHTFYIENSQGCKSADTLIYVPQQNSTIVGFTANPLSGVKPLEVVFENISQNAIQFEWFVNSVSYGSTLPEMLITEEGTYNIELIGWNTNVLCADTAFATIIVFDSIFFQLPNVFSPNGDGANDSFSIECNQDVQMKVQILNRWGEVVLSKELMIKGYVSTPLWDGGNANDGVYFVKITVLNKKGDEVTKNGFIQLIR
jgi:gliding motility-associated-like protein